MLFSLNRHRSSRAWHGCTILINDPDAMGARALGRNFAQRCMVGGLSLSLSLSLSCSPFGHRNKYQIRHRILRTHCRFDSHTHRPCASPLRKCASLIIWRWTHLNQLGKWCMHVAYTARAPDLARRLVDDLGFRFCFTSQLREGAILAVPLAAKCGVCYN